MAQVTSEPGKNQVLANQAVTSSSSEPAASDTKLKATLTTVTYTQTEPGKTLSPINTKRS